MKWNKVGIILQREQLIKRDIENFPGRSCEKKWNTKEQTISGTSPYLFRAAACKILDIARKSKSLRWRVIIKGAGSLIALIALGTSTSEDLWSSVPGYNIPKFLDKGCHPCRALIVARVSFNCAAVWKPRDPGNKSTSNNTSAADSEFRLAPKINFDVPSNVRVSLFCFPLATFASPRNCHSLDCQ